MVTLAKLVQNERDSLLLEVHRQKIEIEELKKELLFAEDDRDNLRQRLEQFEEFATLLRKLVLRTEG